MTPSQQLARARTCVRIFFAEGQTDKNEVNGGLPTDSDAEFRESVFICEGFYRGRRFRSPSMTAVWFAEEDELKIHTIGGELVVSLDAQAMDELAEQTKPDVLPMRPNRPAEPARRAA
ncbi:hypothetical protein [Neorhodopirellula pilleata]|uniref:Uncharacterized protein n=1 Tax=Neorhodopirellula pilleata TaxID=2714738 RepID=A0A5C6AG87_9BACT|nr:hypothetical protein [Neorhodopirellula pilleata]TWT98984.1 hypothetical protein Pla100_21500 [Neorhodopirellula pilleata]